MKTILITGANRGLGLEMVKQYLYAGWKVLACCRSPKHAEELNNLAAVSPDLLHLFELDVASEADIAKLPQKLQNQPIDILMNNAGINRQAEAKFGEISSESWCESFRVNTIAPLLIAQALITQVSSSQLKIIANISSRLGSVTLNTDDGYIVYRSTKAALNSVTKSMANALQSKGITVVALHPGWVKTDMGGVKAPLTPEESIAGIRKMLETVNLQESGLCLDYQHHIVPC